VSIKRLFDAVERRGDIGRRVAALVLPISNRPRVTSSCAGKIGLGEPSEHASGPNLASRDNVAHNPIYIRFWKCGRRSSRFVESRPGHHVCIMVMVLGVALRLSCVTYCHIRIKLAATSTTDELAFLANLIELSARSRQFRLSNEPKMVSDIPICVTSNTKSPNRTRFNHGGTCLALPEHRSTGTRRVRGF